MFTTIDLTQHGDSAMAWQHVAGGDKFR